MITTDQALKELTALGSSQKATEMAAYHKVSRRYLGVSNPVIDEKAKTWRKALSLEYRLSLASGLWDSDTHEGRIAASKLLTQARIRPDDAGAWNLIASWVPAFDAWAIADHASIAGQKRLVWDPSRLDQVESWTTSDHMWTRRAALVMTLPWCRNRNAKTDELAQRERILGWAAGYVDDHDWFIQKSVGWWLRDLSKRDPDRVRAFLTEYGDRMKPFAQREASKYLGA